MPSFPDMTRCLAGLAAVGTLAVTTGAFGQFTMIETVSYFVGPQPSDTAAIDIDDDGDLDLASTVDNPDRVVFLVNNGDGTYGPGGMVLLPNSSSPGDIVAANLAGDSAPDLAVALKDNASVIVLVNSGGTFTNGGEFATQDEPRGMDIADHDADQDMDITVANRDSDSVSILTNNGDGTFTSTHVATGPDPRGAAFGNFAGDAALDVAVTNHDSRAIQIVTNSGGGSFVAGSLLSVGGQRRPEGIDAGDIDGDGDDDIASATNGNGFNSVTVFLNNGGSFSGPIHSPTGGQDTSDITLVDLDCNGSLDAVTSNSDSNNLSFMPNLGGGSFGSAMTMTVGTDPQRPRAADLSGDGTPDVFVANDSSSDVSVLINDTCEPVRPCPGDLDDSGTIDVNDLLAVILAWGNAGGPEDIDQDGIVGVNELIILVLGFGTCP
ncbi:MAG: FG-GAP-like repeat-containing protein [Planctomycetota bacterium]|jgi:hypothetical protein